MVTKRPIIPTTDQGPISKLYPLLTHNFLQATKRIWVVEDSENKRAKGMEMKRARKKNRKGPAKKRSPNFGLCACAKLKYCTFMYPIFREINLFGRKSLFGKFEVHLALWQPKIGYNGKTGIFLVPPWYLKALVKRYMIVDDSWISLNYIINYHVRGQTRKTIIY